MDSGDLILEIIRRLFLVAVTMLTCAPLFYALSEIADPTMKPQSAGASGSGSGSHSRASSRVRRGESPPTHRRPGPPPNPIHEYFMAKMRKFFFSNREISPPPFPGWTQRLRNTSPEERAILAKFVRRSYLVIAWSLPTVDTPGTLPMVQLALTRRHAERIYTYFYYARESNVSEFEAFKDYVVVCRPFREYNVGVTEYERRVIGYFEYGPNQRCLFKDRFDSKDRPAWLERADLPLRGLRRRDLGLDCEVTVISRSPHHPLEELLEDTYTAIRTEPLALCALF